MDVEEMVFARMAEELARHRSLERKLWLWRHWVRVGNDESTLFADLLPGSRRRTFLVNLLAFALLDLGAISEIQFEYDALRNSRNESTPESP